VKALLRLAVAWNIPVARNRASADFVISPPQFARRYDRLQPDFVGYSGDSRAHATSAAQSAWRRLCRPGCCEGPRLTSGYGARSR
jgi:hypothetical protein